MSFGVNMSGVRDVCVFRRVTSVAKSTRFYYIMSPTQQCYSQVSRDSGDSKLVSHYVEVLGELVCLCPCLFECVYEFVPYVCVCVCA